MDDQVSPLLFLPGAAVYLRAHVSLAGVTAGGCVEREGAVGLRVREAPQILRNGK